MSSKLNIEEYSEKSFVVRGDTKPHKDFLLEKHGKWNTKLQGVPGWIFSKKKLDCVTRFVEQVNSREKSKSVEDSDNLSKKRKSMETILESYEPNLSMKIHMETNTEILRRLREDYDSNEIKLRKIEEYIREKNSPTMRIFYSNLLCIICFFIVAIRTGMLTAPNDIKEWAQKNFENVTFYTEYLDRFRSHMNL